jgi:hypothetical protein
MGLTSVLGAVVALFPVTGCGGSSSGVAAGQTCTMATDCAEGLYCYGVMLTSSGSLTPGKCTSNPNLAQPPADGGIPDGGVANMLDSSLMGDGNTTPPPMDTGTPPPEDTGSKPPVDSGGGG